MTREQYIEMAENFASYAGREVEYKSLNLHPTKINASKYNIKKGVLVGVGIMGNAEHLLLQCVPYGGRIAIHYDKIALPAEESHKHSMLVTDETEWADVDRFIHNNVRGGSTIIVK